MRYFITGASGHVGKSLVRELIAHNHQVIGLVRSDTSAAAITALGAEALRGDLEDFDILTKGAANSDGVVHLAFKNDFNDFPGCIALDKQAIQALADGLVGSGKPLAIASGTLLAPTGVLATEETEPERNNPPFSLRAESADLVYKLSKEKNIRGAVVRFSPTVHGKDDHGLIPMGIDIVKKLGFVPYVDNKSRWPAVHKDDLAVLLRLVLEKGKPGATYNAVGESTIPASEIMSTIAKGTGLPLEKVEPGKMFETLGFVGATLLLDNPTSSEQTQKELGWKPTNLPLIADLEANYF